LLLFLIFTCLVPAFSQSTWTLSTVKNDIKIYTRPITNSKLKAIKVECSLNFRPSQLVKVIMDIDQSGQWVYHSKTAYIVKQVSPSELFYYSEVSVPWPAENRDYVSHIMVSQNPKTKVVTIDAPCVTGIVTEKKGIVRIVHSVGKWTIGPLEKNTIKVTYELEVDPAGQVPAWLVNLFATQGPMETFEKLKTQLAKKEYKEVKLSFVVD